MKLLYSAEPPIENDISSSEYKNLSAGSSFFAGFCWGRVNFPSSRFYGDMFQTCAKTSVDNRGMLLSLLKAAQSQDLFCFSYHPTSKETGGAEGMGGGAASSADPN